MTDFTGALRASRKNPGSSAIAIVTMGVAIAANAATFSAYDRAVLHPGTWRVLVVAQGGPPLAPLGRGSPAPVPIEQRGLAVGERIPPLNLLDQAGRRRDLKDLTGPRGLVLLFVRSADW